MAIDDEEDSESDGNPPSDDGFFTSDDERERINAFEIDQHEDWLIEQGWEPGDMFPVRWEDATGNDYEMEIPLPDWTIDGWGSFYDDMRDFYEDVWGDDESPEGGAATGG